MSRQRCADDDHDLAGEVCGGLGCDVVLGGECRRCGAVIFVCHYHEKWKPEFEQQVRSLRERIRSSPTVMAMIEQLAGSA